MSIAGLSDEILAVGGAGGLRRTAGQGRGADLWTTTDENETLVTEAIVMIEEEGRDLAHLTERTKDTVSLRT